jgi:hypothetical protein
MGDRHRREPVLREEQAAHHNVPGRLAQNRNFAPSQKVPCGHGLVREDVGQDAGKNVRKGVENPSL